MTRLEQIKKNMYRPHKGYREDLIFTVGMLEESLELLDLFYKHSDKSKHKGVRLLINRIKERVNENAQESSD